MKSKLTAACVACLGVLVVSWASAQEADAELKKLQGTWRAIGAEAMGKQVPEEAFAKHELTITIDGTKYVQKENDKVHEEGTLKVLADKNPKQLETEVTKGKEEGKKHMLIYKIEGDRMTVAVNPMPGGEPPTSFTTQPDSKFHVMTFKKQK